MDDSTADTATRLMHRLLRMSRRLYRDDPPGDLTFAQQAALRYFGAANRFSRTVSGFAAYHVTTKSTASKIVAEFDRRGLITRTPWPEDRRRVRIDLTEKGRELLSGDPVLEAAEAVRELPDRFRERLVDDLEHLVGEVGRRTGTRSFGVCADCAHAEDADGDEGAYYCCYYEAILSEDEAQRLCSDVAPTG